MNVNPSAIVRRLLMSATARARDGGRTEIDVAGLLLALTSDEATHLAESGASPLIRSRRDHSLTLASAAWAGCGGVHFRGDHPTSSL